MYREKGNIKDVFGHTEPFSLVYEGKDLSDWNSCYLNGPALVITALGYTTPPPSTNDFYVENTPLIS